MRILAGCIVLIMLILGSSPAYLTTFVGSEAWADKLSGTNRRNEPKNVTIAYIAMVNASPQAMIGIEENIFTKELSCSGVTIDWVLTRSNNRIYPLMDEGAVDFVYLPSQNVFTYMAENTQFGGSDRFTIVAGSLNNNSFILMAADYIQSLEDLNEKTVGVANHFYMEEMLLSRQLQDVGLKTRSNGGTVNIEYVDWMNKLFEKFASGEYAAITSWNSLRAYVEKKIPGSKFLINLNDGSKFGETVPQVWLLARKSLVNNDHDLVKHVLKAHVKATDRALQSRHELADLSAETLEVYYNNSKASKHITYSKSFYENEWQSSEPTYDPNLSFIQSAYDFMVESGYLVGKSLENMIDISLLNEVLVEQGRAEIR